MTPKSRVLATLLAFLASAGIVAMFASPMLLLPVYVHLEEPGWVLAALTLPAAALLLTLVTKVNRAPWAVAAGAVAAGGLLNAKVHSGPSVVWIAAYALVGGVALGALVLAAMSDEIWVRAALATGLVAGIILDNVVSQLFTLNASGDLRPYVAALVLIVIILLAWQPGPRPETTPPSQTSLVLVSGLAVICALGFWLLHLADRASNGEQSLLDQAGSLTLAALVAGALGLHAHRSGGLPFVRWTLACAGLGAAAADLTAGSGAMDYYTTPTRIVFVVVAAVAATFLALRRANTFPWEVIGLLAVAAGLLVGGQFGVLPMILGLTFALCVTLPEVGTAGLALGLAALLLASFVQSKLTAWHLFRELGYGHSGLDWPLALVPAGCAVAIAFAFWKKRETASIG